MAPPKRTVTTRALTGALYLMVAGGPYALEELLASVGPMVAIGVLIATPIVWSLPSALMVGELSAALPEEGGYFAWVRRALGPFFGFQEAWLSMAASIFDMAIYPTIFISYLSHFDPRVATHPWDWLIGGGMLILAALSNARGSKSVGDASFVSTLLLLLPFLALTALLVFSARPSLPATLPHVRGDLLGGILIAMWNTMGWDNASTIAGEVKDPQRTYPRAVVFSILLVTLTYVVPTAAVAFAHIDTTGWETGAWVDLGRAVGGAPLALAIVMGGLLCGFGMLNALVLSYSRIPMVLAESGYLPSVLSKRSATTDAPVIAIFVSCAMWMMTLGISFDRLVSIDILLYGIALLLEFIALAVLRMREPNLHRPYKIPGGTTVAWLLGVPPLALLVVALIKNEHETLCGMNALLFGALVVALGPLLYLILRGRFTAQKSPPT